MNIRGLVKRLFRRNMVNDKRLKDMQEEYTGVQLSSNYSSDDIFLVSYPKSGNTWMRYLISGVVYGLDLSLAPNQLALRLVPDLETSCHYFRFCNRMIFKSHLLPTKRYRRVIYLIRDGRDVMVSYYHFLKQLRDSVSLEGMITDGKDLDYGIWSEHVNAWLDNPYNADMHIVKYEDLLDDPLKEIKRMCVFLNIDRDDASIKKAISDSSFTNLQTKERAGLLDSDARYWDKSKVFFRRGISGSYKDEMPDDLLRLFETNSEKALRRGGYI